MLKKRTTMPAMIFCGSLLLAPGLSQASPLTWMPEPDSLAKIARWWDLLPGLGHHAPVAKPVPRQGTPVKNGCGIDPNGGTEPVCGTGTSGATSTSTDPGSGI
jgi:hypothetical protein